MKHSITIFVDNQNLMSYIESTFYERNSRMDLLTYAMSMNMDIETDSFKQYEQELIEYKREYDIAIQTLIDDYIKPALKKLNIDEFNYSVNFEDSSIEITYDSEEQHES